MGTVNVNLGEASKLNLILGQQLENAVTSVVFDFSAWQTAYGSGTLGLSVQRPGDEMPYAVTMTVSGTNATWSITSLDTAYTGVGEIQVTYTVGSVVKKSVVYKFTVYKSLGENGEYPSPGQSWQEDMEDKIADIKSDLLSLDKFLDLDVAKGTSWYPIEIKNGEQYTIVNNIATWINVFTTSSYGSTTALQTAWDIGPNKSLIVNITADANYLRIYTGVAGNIVFRNNTKKVPVLESEVIMNNARAFMGHKNMMSDFSLTDGYFIPASNGVPTSNAYFKASDFIPVLGAEKVGVGYGMAQFAFYDKYKKYLSGVSIASAAHYYTEYSVPANACYARFSIDATLDDYAYFTLNDGRDISPLGDYVTVGTTIKGDFETIRAGAEYALKYHGITVYIMADSYDLLSEFATEINASSTTQYGIGLGKEMHLVFAPNAIVTALYTGNDVNVTTYFAPFYTVGNGGYTVEGLMIRASATRYCVHDDIGDDTSVGTHTFKNCMFYFDNTNAPNDYYPQCVGGGMGKSTSAIFDGCYFETKASQNAVKPALSYHNTSWFNGAYGRILVQNCYFAYKGTVAGLYYGTTERVSLITINNCELGSTPFLDYAHSGDSTPQNVSLLTYNNVIRA